MIKCLKCYSDLIGSYIYGGTNVLYKCKDCEISYYELNNTFRICKHIITNDTDYLITYRKTKNELCILYELSLEIKLSLSYDNALLLLFLPNNELIYKINKYKTLI